MKYNLLVIDDDKVMHIFAKRILGEDYNVLHAHGSQEAVDVLAEQTVHVILCDIHMPGVDGLEFLESLMKDAERKNIPVLIMTGKPTVEKEKDALDLGASDFIDKLNFSENPEQIIEKINVKMVTTIDMKPLSQDLEARKKAFVKRLTEVMQTADFFKVTDRISSLLLGNFSVDHLYFWTIQGKDPRLVRTMGVKELQHFGPKDLVEEKTFQDFLEKRGAYLSNHVFGDEPGIFKKASEKADLPAEIGVPLYAFTDRDFIKNNKRIPPKCKIFGYMVLKRRKMFSTREFNLISKLLIQSGTVLWRLYERI